MRTIRQLFFTLALASGSFAAGTNDDNDIRETVFRYLFEHNGSGLQRKAPAYFLCGPGESDLENELMKRFGGHQPPVRICSASLKVPEGVVDRNTGKRGLRFNAEDIKWLSDFEVEAGGGHYEGNQGASGHTYTVKKRNGKWNVTKDVMNYVK